MFGFAGANTGILHHAHACSRNAHPLNVQLSFCAHLHKELYRYANTAEPQLYVLIASMSPSKHKYIKLTLFPVPSENRNLPNNNMIYILVFCSIVSSSEFRFNTSPS